MFLDLKLLVVFGWGRNLQCVFDDDWTFLLDLQDVICM